MTRIAPHTRTKAQDLRKSMTPQERKLWGKLREVNRMLGLHFRRQAPIGPFIADFAELGRRLVIETDGGGHGGEDDARRDGWLQAQGFRVMRFWNNDVDENPEGVMQAILDRLDVGPDAPPPQPSPTRGEGGAKSELLPDALKPGASPPLRPERLGVGGMPQARGQEGSAP